MTAHNAISARTQAKPLSELKVPQQVEDVEIVDEEEVIGTRLPPLIAWH